MSLECQEEFKGSFTTNFFNVRIFKFPNMRLSSDIFEYANHQKHLFGVYI